MGKFSFKNSAKKNKNLKYGGYMTIVVVLALIAFVVVNILFQQLHITVDLTPEKLYTIGSRTTLILEDVEDEVTIYGLYVSGNENTEAIALIEDYIKNSDKIHYQQVDPYTNPEFTQPYTQAGETIATNSLIVVNENTGKYKIVKNSDLYEYTQTLNQQTYSYDYQITAFQAEETLTSAIQYVTSENTPVLYQLTGHGETELSSGVQSLLTDANFGLESYSFTSAETPLEANDYTVLIINNPTSDLTDLEYEDLQAYLDDGGRLMINLSVAYPETMENFNRLLARYGVTVHRGSMIETNSEYYYRYQNLILPDVGEHDATEDVSKGQVAQLWSVGFTVSEERNRSTEITPILTTSEDAIIKANPASEVMDLEEGDEKGQFYTGLEVLPLTVTSAMNSGNV